MCVGGVLREAAAEVLQPGLCRASGRFLWTDGPVSAVDVSFRVPVSVSLTRVLLELLCPDCLMLD